MEPSPEDVARRRQWFDWYVEQLNNNSVRHFGCGPFHCPCCGCKTLDQRGDFDICPVCFWEDDGQDDHDADVVRGGSNGSLSLTQARQNFIRIGACEESMLENVRPPRPHELPEGK
jgi:hypothetical protein